MKMYQFYALQCSIFLVGSFASSVPLTKIVCLGIALFYLICQVMSIRDAD